MGKKAKIDHRKRSMSGNKILEVSYPYQEDKHPI